MADRKSLPLLAALLLAAGCSMNPKLETPPAPVPASFPGVGADEAQSAASIGWREMFVDPRLQQLIALALDNNRDLRIATLNVDAARAMFRSADAQRYPWLGTGAGYTHQRMAAGQMGAGVPAVESEQFSVNAGLTMFEIDLFGQLRSQSQAAFQRYLSSDEGRRAARLALIGGVVDAYLAERLAAEQLALTDRTLADWQISLNLARQLQQARQASGLDVAQAEELVRRAEADQAAGARGLAQATNALTLLVGAPLPADLPPPIPLMEQPILTRLPAGLPSALLTARPDIRAAERALVAANADVGAARAAFFPRISITGLFGVASNALSNLFESDSRMWTFTPQISQPLFQGGALRAELRLAEVRKSVAVAEYELAIQTAFREVADGLAGRDTFAQQSAAQREGLAAATRRVRLSDLRFRAGVDSRLDLLDAQRSEYAAQQALLTLRQQELSNASALYRALGGGDE